MRHRNRDHLFRSRHRGSRPTVFRHSQLRRLWIRPNSAIERESLTSGDRDAIFFHDPHGDHAPPPTPVSAVRNSWRTLRRIAMICTISWTPLRGRRTSPQMSRPGEDSGTSAASARLAQRRRRADVRAHSRFPIATLNVPRSVTDRPTQSLQIRRTRTAVINRRQHHRQVMHGKELQSVGPSSTNGAQ